jgi:hypothetical protein
MKLDVGSYADFKAVTDEIGGLRGVFYYITGATGIVSSLVCDGVNVVETSTVALSAATILADYPGAIALGGGNLSVTT